MARDVNVYFWFLQIFGRILKHIVQSPNLRYFKKRITYWAKRTYFMKCCCFRQKKLWPLNCTKENINFIWIIFCSEKIYDTKLKVSWIDCWHPYSWSPNVSCTRINFVKIIVCCLIILPLKVTPDLGTSSVVEKAIFISKIIVRKIHHARYTPHYCIISYSFKGIVTRKFSMLLLVSLES
jgi:hypothetical protein